MLTLNIFQRHSRETQLADCSCWGLSSSDAGTNASDLSHAGSDAAFDASVVADEEPNTTDDS
jgi:hypothetical protein